MSNCYLIIHLLWLLSYSTYAQVNKVGNRIETTPITMHCAFIQDLCVIQNQKEFDIFVTSLDPGCIEQNQAPVIDFKKYSLIGFGAGASGCGPPIIGLELERMGNKKVIVHAEVASEGLCKGYFYGKTWCLIPRQSKKTEFEVKVKKTHTVENE